MNSHIDVLRIVRLSALALIAVIAVAWIAVGLDIIPTGRETPSLGTPAIVPFNLIDQKNGHVTERDILGHPTVVFFGFTYCPEICPTTLTSLTALLGRLGSTGDRLGVVFVTVDPERDTPQALSEFLSSFDPRIRGLTGPGGEIARIARGLGVYYRREQLPGGGYTMDHTASLFLLDARGRFAGTISYGENADVALEKLRRLATTAG